MSEHDLEPSLASSIQNFDGLLILRRGYQSALSISDLQVVESYILELMNQVVAQKEAIKALSQKDFVKANLISSWETNGAIREMLTRFESSVMADLLKIALEQEKTKQLCAKAKEAEKLAEAAEVKADSDKEIAIINKPQVINSDVATKVVLALGGLFTLIVTGAFAYFGVSG
jgi:hypothetical protein